MWSRRVRSIEFFLRFFPFCLKKKKKTDAFIEYEIVSVIIVINILFLFCEKNMKKKNYIINYSFSCVGYIRMCKRSVFYKRMIFERLDANKL